MPEDGGTGPTTPEPATEEPEDPVQRDIEREMAEGLEESMKQLSTQIEQASANSKNFIETEDLEDLFHDGPTDVWVPTGRFASDGSPKKFKVQLKDPGSEAVIVAYLAGMSQVRKKPEMADLVTRSLWRSVVVTPKEITEKEGYKKTPSAFRNNLTFTILSFLGIDGDFLARVEGMSTPQERRLAKALSKPSPKPTGNIPPPSDAGGNETSEAPTTTSSDDGSKNDARTPSTSTGPSPTSSAPLSAVRSGRASRTPSSSPPSPSSAESPPTRSTR